MAQQGCRPHIGSDNPESRRRVQRASRQVSVASATAHYRSRRPTDQVCRPWPQGRPVSPRRPFYSTEAIALVEMWDRQQGRHRPERESALHVLVDLVEAAVGSEGGLVVELGSGCGSVLRRLRERIPSASLVGIDKDPVLCRIAREVFASDAAVEVRQADMRALGPAFGLAAASAAAIVSCTSLHWLPAEDIREIYRCAHAMLRPGGVFCNVDWMPLRADQRLRTLADRYRDGHEARESAAGIPDWGEWWEAVRGVQWLTESMRLRDAERASDATRPAEFMPEIAWHEQALLAAGFEATAEIWRAFDSAAVVASK
jgi:SAM-dependent methyltransferase